MVLSLAATTDIQRTDWIYWLHLQSIICRYFLLFPWIFSLHQPGAYLLGSRCCRAAAFLFWLSNQCHG